MAYMGRAVDEVDHGRCVAKNEILHVSGWSTSGDGGRHAMGWTPEVRNWRAMIWKAGQLGIEQQ